MLTALIVAAPEPEIPANIMFARTETIPMPASMKSGPAMSEKEFIPRMACCTAMKAGISLPNIIASSPERPIAKLTGTPSTRKIRSVTRDISIIYLFPSRYSFASWGMALA